MHLIETIIQNREHILSLAANHGVKTLKLYGSVLAREETEHSNINFLAVFDPSLSINDGAALFDLLVELEGYFERVVYIVDSRRIPDAFRPSIDTDPVDIMELSSDKTYPITPKTSRLYFLMLVRLFRNYNFEINQTMDDEELYDLLASKISWWFSRLLRLKDNDLKDYNGFDFVEVLYLCDKLSAITMWAYTDADLKRFKELIPKIRDYAQSRLAAYEEHR